MGFTRFAGAGCLTAKRSAVALLVALTACVSAAGAAHQLVPEGLQYLIVIYMENHSFDNLYGEFPGANGLSDATSAKYLQIDTGTGEYYSTLPWSDPSFVPTPVLPNAPFEIGALRPPSQTTRDLVPRYY